jgi:hypothetical protein
MSASPLDVISYKRSAISNHLMTWLEASASKLVPDKKQSN